MPAGLRGQVGGLGNRHDGIGERGLEGSVFLDHWEGSFQPQQAPGCLQVDASVIWEYVNSIQPENTSMNVPNLRIISLLLMYTYVQRWTIIPALERRHGRR